MKRALVGKGTKVSVAEPDGARRICPFHRKLFLLVKIDRTGIDALQLRFFLSRKKILIRACDSFAGLGADYFRIAVKRRKDNLRLLAALREWTASSIG